MVVYMLRCEDNSLYTGIAADLNRRIKQHLGELKGGAKYTKSHKICYVEVIWQTSSQTEAKRIEYAVKQLSKLEKEKLLKSPEKLITDFLVDFSDMNISFVSTEEINKHFNFYK